MRFNHHIARGHEESEWEKNQTNLQLFISHTPPPPCRATMCVKFDVQPGWATLAFVCGRLACVRIAHCSHIIYVIILLYDNTRIVQTHIHTHTHGNVSIFIYTHSNNVGRFMRINKNVRDLSITW